MNSYVSILNAFDDDCRLEAGKPESWKVRGLVGSAFELSGSQAFRLALRLRRAADARDLTLLNRHAGELNAEMADVVDYQGDL